MLPYTRTQSTTDRWSGARSSIQCTDALTYTYTQLINSTPEQELALFNPVLASKPQVVVLNKIDLPDVRDKMEELKVN